MEKKLLIPYIKEITGDLDTPITLYQKYIGEDIGILLESKEEGKGRYSILGKNPYLTVKTVSDNIVIEQDGKKTEKKGKILEVIKEYTDMIDVKKDERLPFLGGAVGTVGYDIIKQYEDIPDDMPDVTGLPDAHLMFITEMIIYDHYYQKIMIVVLEEGKNKNKANKRISEIEKELKLKKVNPDFYKKDETVVGTNIKSNTTKEEYINMVKKSQQYIKDGDIFQVVLSQRWKMESQEHPFNLYRSLRSINPSPYLFYLNFGDYQVAGSSPEMLVELRGKKVYTCPIAGTRKRGKDSNEDKYLADDLLHDPKERAEHIMLVDLARNDMGRVSQMGTVEVTDFMKVQYYSHVMHLVSLVEGIKKNEDDMYSILSTFLPAGTLSGAPKIRAMEIIQELEKEKRGIYGGSVGYFGFDGDMDTCIAIRTMVMADHNVYMQAGAGITTSSIPEKEYEECKNKIRALMKATVK
ncbi:MAG: anthranilate synthase component I [Fusobacteriota bacterium]